METTGNVRLRCENVSYSYDGHTYAVKNININLVRGKVYALVGAMASGKTTLMKIMARLLRPSRGAVYLGDASIFDMKEKEFRRQVGFSFQYPDRGIFAMTVYEEVVFSLKMMFPEKKNEFKNLVKVALRKVGLNEAFMERNPHFLSGGEKRRVALASVVVYNPSVLLLDEPTAALDSYSRNKILNFLREYAAQGNIVVFTTHSLSETNIADNILVMKDGSIFPVSGDMNFAQWVDLGLLPTEEMLYMKWGRYHGYA